jgi:hypothetical protein
VTDPNLDRVNFLPVPNGSLQSPGPSAYEARRNSSVVNGNEIDIP